MLNGEPNCSETIHIWQCRKMDCIKDTMMETRRRKTPSKQPETSLAKTVSSRIWYFVSNIKHDQEEWEYINIILQKTAELEPISVYQETHFHYENTPIQIYRKFHLQKLKIFRYKNSDIFHISAQNVDCGYSLEPPRRGGSNEYPQSTFWAEIRKIMYTPVNPSFTI